MGRKKFLGIVLGLVLFSVGCATTGYEDFVNNQPESAPTINQETIKQDITCGQTTKEDVLRVFGSPKYKSVSGNQNEEWTYQIVEVTNSDNKKALLSALGGNNRLFAHVTNLTVIFDQKRVVIDYHATSNNP